MNYFIIGWLTTLITSIIWPTLPSSFFLIVSLIIGILTVRRAPFVTGCLLALCYLSWQASQYEAAVNQIMLQGRYHNIKGVVEAVSGNTYQQHFVLQIKYSDLTPSSLFIGRSLRLSQYRQKKPLTPIQVGDSVAIRASLKPAHASLNQGGFNYQRVLVSKNIIATGTSYSITILARSSSVRVQLIRGLGKVFQNIAQGGILYALTTGDKSRIPYEQRQRWMHSGVGHLLAISGLHLGILAFWGALIGRIIALFVSSRWRPTIVMTLAISFAAGYGYLAGWPISAQRAMVMLVVWLASRQNFIWLSHLDGWLLALFIVTAIWPLAILTAGLWLSFTAILAIYLLLWSCPWRGWLRIVWIQCGLLILLLPLQLLLFGYFSWAAIPLNLIFVPLFSFAIVPLVFIGILLYVAGSSFAVSIMVLAGHLVAMLDASLHQLSSRVLLAFPISEPTGLTILLMVVAAGVVLWHFRWRKLVWLGVLLLLPEPPMALRGWRIDFLDVGQGLSVIIENAGHALIYDTGARYPSGFSYASAVILPFIHARGDLSVDRIVVSHADIDHAGGLPLLEQQFPKAKLTLGDDPRFLKHNCQGNYLWHRLVITFVQPKVQGAKANNLSCMLLIDDGVHRVLLTGDIESDAERWWIKHHHLPVDGISVPHHGSRSSSTKRWLQTLHPKWAIVSSGFMNAYQLPASSIIRRYHRLDIPVLNTASSGQISILYGDAETKLIRYRNNIAPFWYNREPLLDNSH